MQTRVMNTHGQRNGEGLQQRWGARQGQWENEPRAKTRSYQRLELLLTLNGCSLMPVWGENDRVSGWVPLGLDVV